MEKLETRLTHLLAWRTVDEARIYEDDLRIWTKAGSTVRKLQASLFVTSLFLSASMALAPEAQAKSAGSTQLEVLEHAGDHLDVRVTVGELSIQPAQDSPEGFVRVALAGQEGSTQRVGAPALPTLSTLVELPFAGAVEVEVLSATQERVSVDRVSPVQPSRSRCQSQSRVFEMDQAYYQGDRVYPETLATVSSAMKIRGVDAARLMISPVSYDAGAQELVVTKSMTLRVHIKGTVLRRSATHHQRSAGLDQQMLTLPKPVRGLKATPNETMLIVLGKDAYRKEIEKLARWKERRGLNVVIKTTQELGGNRVDAIKKAAQELYDDSEVDLAYLLLVGDQDVKAPTVPITSSSQMDSDGVGEADYRYSLLDGDDLVGDISVGRFSVTSEAQLKSMVQKVLYYEQEMGQDEDDADLSWIETAVGIASSEKASGPSDTQRMQKIIQSFKSSGYDDIDEFYQAARPDPDELVTAINKGRGFISYMGHGNGSAWRFKNGFNFDLDHVKEVAAKKQWPIVMDCACTNGDFWNRDPSFSEMWQRGAEGKDPVGALGIVSSTIIAAWDPPAVMAEAMFAQVLKEPALTLGGMVTSGLLEMAKTFPGSKSMELTRDTFVLFGDPSLNVRAFAPDPVIIKKAAKKKSRNKLSFEVMRKDPKKGKVAAYPAVAALSLDGELVVSARTDKEGEVTLEIPKDVDAEELELVVTGHRLVAYEDTVTRDAEEEENADKSQQGDTKASDDESKEDSQASDDDSDTSNSDDGGSDSSSDSSGKNKDKEDGKGKGCAVQEDASGLFGMLVLLGLAAIRRRR